MTFVGADREPERGGIKVEVCLVGGRRHAMINYQQMRARFQDRDCRHAVFIANKPRDVFFRNGGYSVTALDFPLGDRLAVEMHPHL